MGEVSKFDAEIKKEFYMDMLSKIKKMLRENFEDMDFVNAHQRDLMEENVEIIEQEYNKFISKLENMTFE